MRALVVVALLVVAAVLVAECKPIPKSTANSKEKLRERTRAKLAKTKALSAKGRDVVAKKQHRMQTQLASLMLDLEKHDKKMEAYKHSKSSTQHTLDAEYIHKMEAKMQDMSKTVERLRNQISKLEQTAKSKPLHTLAEDPEKTKEAPKEDKKDEKKKEEKKEVKEVPEKKAEEKKTEEKKTEEKKETEEKKASRQLEESEESRTQSLEESEDRDGEYSGDLEESESDSGSDADNDAVESAIQDSVHSRTKRSKAAVEKDDDDDMTEFNKDEMESEASQAAEGAELEESESDSGSEAEGGADDGPAEAEKAPSHKKVRDMDAKPKQKNNHADNEDGDNEGGGNDVAEEPGILDSLGISPYLPSMPTIFGGEEDVDAQLNDATALENDPYGAEAENAWF